MFLPSKSTDFDWPYFRAWREGLFQAAPHLSDPGLAPTPDLCYKESAKSGYAPPVLTAMACVRIGDKQCAFEWLEKGFQERDDVMINLKVEPVFDGLRADPRFQDLVRRVGIP